MPSTPPSPRPVCPAGAASLVPSPERSAGWALFSDRRLALAVARGSGAAVGQLGAVAQQVGTPVSLHGTGGAWIVTGQGCDGDRLEAVVANSLDRKVCNTVNTVCVLRSRLDDLMPRVTAGLQEAARRRSSNPKVHVVDGAQGALPAEWFTEKVAIGRSGGDVQETRAEMIDPHRLGHEWEWEESPEITVVAVGSVEEAVRLFNETVPAFCRVAHQRRRSRTGPLLRHGRLSLRRRWVHPVGRWSVRPEPT